MEISRFNRHYNSIDLCKFIMAFAVVAIHTQPFKDCENNYFLCAYDILVSLAVPFFFLASGYLLAIKMDYPYGSERDLSRLKRQTIKIAQMYLTWTLAYFPLAVYHFISSGTSLTKAVLMYIRGFVFIGEHYNSWQLWYLLSTIYSLIIIRFALKIWKSSSAMITISIIASVISVGFTALVNYEGDMISIMALTQKMVRYTFANGRLFDGLVYIPIGMLIAHKRIPNVLNWLCLIVGFITNYFIYNDVRAKTLCSKPLFFWRVKF